MEVTHHTHGTHAVVGGVEMEDFSIANTAQFFTVLSKTLYTNEILAVVREIICNAWDAHIAAGRTDKPIEITINETEMVIRDYGNGIPHDRMHQTYFVYGLSDKLDDITQTGGLRITPLRQIPPEPTLPPELTRAPTPKALLEENKAFDDPTAQHSATNPEFVHAKLDELQKAADELGEDPEDVAAAAEFHDKLVENGGTNEGMGKMMPEPTPPDSEVAHGGGALSTPQEAPQEAPMTAPAGTYRERCQKLWGAYKAASSDAVRLEAAKAIMALKKDSKKGWDKLNMDSSMVKMIEDTIAGKPPAPEPKKTETKASNTTKTLSSKMGGKKVEVPPAATEGMSKVQMTRYLYDRWNKDNSAQNGEALLAHKKASKKSWAAMGLYPEEINTIKMFLENK